MIGASLGLAANGGILTAGLLRGQAGISAETLAAMPGPMTEMTPSVIATLPVAAGQEVVAVFASAFSMVFYTGAGLFALGLVCALAMKNVKLESHGKEPAGEPSGQPVLAE